MLAHRVRRGRGAIVTRCILYKEAGSLAESDTISMAMARFFLVPLPAVVAAILEIATGVASSWRTR